MNNGRTVFSQLMSFLPVYELKKCITRYKGDHRVRTFTCREHFYVMCFAQLTARESLRDIESCLTALSGKLYHSGIKRPVSRSTLADANERRDWRIYADFAQVLIGQARELYRGDNGFLKEIDQTAYALDSTAIDLCLNLFPWARLLKNKGAVKMHTLLDLEGSIPVFIDFTDGLVHDVNILDRIVIEPGAFYVMDMAYTDFERLFRIHRESGCFLVRAKSNMACRRVYSRAVDKATGLKYDQTVALTGHHSKQKYPEHLRRIKFHDVETGKTFVFLTNNFGLDALDIAKMYKERWAIELFFKWIKQHLRIKSFYGYSLNAVSCQIWIVICTYLLVAIVGKRLGNGTGLHTLLQVFNLTVFEKTPLNELFTNKNYTNMETPNSYQLILFDL
ncbi:IS4 family transposase [Maribacter sp. 2307ULW6-5]|uniref:IS4 family transposase n=1 Tax=Maribacter sp. 2307ULW6-5 TaxID=3386275 RepID=UPI0039BC26F9